MRELDIGVVGEFDPAFAPHRATNAALDHAAAILGVALRVTWLPTDTLKHAPERTLESLDGLWCAPGSPYRSLEDALQAVRFAREQDRPFIGTCGGFQHTVLVYARNVLGLEDAQHAEYDPYASHLFVSALACSLAGQRMRVEVQTGSQAFALYGQAEVWEDYYCNFGLNPRYQQDLEKSGLRITGRDQDGEVRIVELPAHRFLLATLFVPQTSSTPRRPHPLVSGFVAAAQQFSTERHAGAVTSIRQSR